MREREREKREKRREREKEFVSQRIYYPQVDIAIVSWRPRSDRQHHVFIPKLFRGGIILRRQVSPPPPPMLMIGVCFEYYQTSASSSLPASLYFFRKEVPKENGADQ